MGPRSEYDRVDTPLLFLIRQHSAGENGTLAEQTCRTRGDSVIEQFAVAKIAQLKLIEIISREKETSGEAISFVICFILPQITKN